MLRPARYQRSILPAWYMRVTVPVGQCGVWRPGISGLTLQTPDKRIIMAALLSALYKCMIPAIFAIRFVRAHYLPLTAVWFLIWNVSADTFCQYVYNIFVLFLQYSPRQIRGHTVLHHRFTVLSRYCQWAFVRYDSFRCPAESQICDTKRLRSPWYRLLTADAAMEWGVPDIRWLTLTPPAVKRRHQERVSHCPLRIQMSTIT